ncbi:MAG TPA: phage tail protein I [Candidatus Limnocylindrales bacterium]|nr:phage tail protein I [Candidatus Limnocylindrales bacterium]
MRSGLALEVRSPMAVATGEEFELRNPHPIVDTLPGVFREAFLDEQRRTARTPFGARFISALDSVLAPVIETIDNMDSYFDADTTPEDFLAWLGSWVAASVDAGWPEDRRRAFVGQAAELYRRRGTADGLRDHVQIHTGGVVEIIENGASSWSVTADGKLPGTPEAVVVVRVTIDDPDAIDKVKLDELVMSSKPAHVVHRIEILGSGSRGGKKAKGDAPAGATVDVASVIADVKAEAKKATRASADEATPTARLDAAPVADAAAAPDTAPAAEAGATADAAGAAADAAPPPDAASAAGAPAIEPPAATAPEESPKKAKGDAPAT